VAEAVFRDQPGVLRVQGEVELRRQRRDADARAGGLDEAAVDSGEGEGVGD
jgi:hypothetical protein